jgi:hypothetical protein
MISTLLDEDDRILRLGPLNALHYVRLVSFICKRGHENESALVRFQKTGRTVDASLQPEEAHQALSRTHSLLETLALLDRLQDVGLAEEAREFKSPAWFILGQDHSGDIFCSPGMPLWCIGPSTRTRSPIPSDLRRAIYDRDGWTCVACGATTDLTLDHIRPWSLGGPDTPDNLRTLCRPCNSRKGARV